MRINTPFAITVSILSIFFCQSGALADSKIILDLTGQIERSTNKQSKAKLYVYRARNYELIQETDLAEQDYFSALKIDSKGPVWCELGKFYATHKKYEKAEKVINKVEQDFKYLQKDIAPLSSYVREQLRLAYLEEHPPEIIFDKVAYKKRSRLDVKKEIEAANARRGIYATTIPYKGVRSNPKPDNGGGKRAESWSGYPPSGGGYAPPPAGGGRSGVDIGRCMGDCGADQGICMGQCRGDGQCIARCAQAQTRCVSRCH